MHRQSGGGRRDFLKNAIRAPALSALAAPRAAPFVGIQMGPHTILDEGIERALDLVQETARVNALLVYSHTYHSDIRKPPQMLATDHGGAPREMRGRKLPSVWVKHHESAFRDRRASAHRSASGSRWRR